VQRFHEQIASTPHTWVEAGAGTFFQNTPFYPVIEMVRQFLGDAPDQIAQLESRLLAVGLKAAEVIPLLAPLLNLPQPTQYPPSALSPEQQRRRLLATLVEWVLGSASGQPLVIATEDLHWVDPSTLELIQLLVEQGVTARLLLLYTGRPEFQAPWTMRAHHTLITLNRLSANNVRTMVVQVAASKALTDDTVAAVVERTGGIPLFVEELTRDMLERGSGTPREIPATLHDSLMARLDRLGPAKEVIQVGAAIGSEFSYELLHAVHPIGEGNLQQALGRLAEAELLYVRGIAPDATYQFKHALIRDAAYEALLKSRRKELHLIIARTIDDKFVALKQSHPEVLARHWSEGGETDLAIAAWTEAGEIAETRNAFREALESYQRALALLKLLQESPERDIRELELRQSIFSTLNATTGWAAPETVDAAERAAVLAEKSGNLKQLANWVRSKATSTLLGGDYPAASSLADQALELAVREGSPTNLAAVHELQLQTRFLRGDHVGAELHFAAGLEFFEDAGFRQIAALAIVAFGAASWNAWTLGHIDVTRDREIQMFSVVNKESAFDLAFSGYFSAYLRYYLRDYEQAEVLGARALELSQKHEFHYLTALCRCVLGPTRAHLGRATEGVELARKGIAGLTEIGTRSGLSRFFAYLAAAQEREGAFADALESIERAILASPFELANRPETLRLRGQLRLHQREIELAKADFREAIALAQSMSAKAWELRATTSLARLPVKQGSRDEARKQLADIFNWFTEGFDTAT
jgi:tetratricopeptide (TPR) repeat protein